MDKLNIELKIEVVNELYKNEVINEKQYRKLKELLELKFNKAVV